MKVRFSSAVAIVLLLAFAVPFRPSVGTAYAAGACNAAQFVADVTIPDGTYEDPGELFVKTWRLKNVGTCTWTTSYGVVFDSGEQMGGPDLALLPEYVSPGEAVNVSVTLTAPMTAGIFRGYWKLKSSSGQIFGIGPAQSSAFWVEIRVLTPLQTSVAYDFVSEWCSAEWVNEGGPIPCLKNISKLQLGYVERLDNPTLETGFPAGFPGLLTVPQAKYNGLIRGIFPVDDIFRGDRFQAIVGCQYGAINCYVTFALEYETQGDFFTIWKFRERYDGLVAPVDIDLTRFAGMRKIHLVLAVFASGPAEPDLALWVAPRIVRQTSAPPATSTPTPTITPTPTDTPIASFTPTPTSTLTGGGTATPTPAVSGDCNRAQFISDVTVPDGTILPPNATFYKIWRLKNVGTCTWTTGYSLVFASGDRMGGADTLIPQTVVPGQTVDVGVNLTAPSLAGSYRGYWQLKSDAGALFGIGSTYDKSFWVDIKVVGSIPGGTTALDFVTSVCSAQWVSASGVLPCPGTDGDSRGFVLPVTSPRLENGVTDSRPGLLTFPQSIYNGYIQGVYPAFTVKSGDRFQAILSCEYGAMDCFVIFRLDYRIAGGLTHTLGTFGERYDGLYYPADIDVSSLDGQSVNFILTVLANGYATGDRALWVAPRITRLSTIGDISPITPSPTVPAATSTPIPTSTPAYTPTAVPTSTPTDTPVPPPTDTPTMTSTVISPTATEPATATPTP